MTHKSLLRHVQLFKLTGKQPRGHPRPRWSNYISTLAWSRLGVEPAELSEIAVDCDVSKSSGCCPRDPPLRRSRHENE